jgi:hypothetical protein
MLVVEPNIVKLLEDLKTSIGKIGVEGTIQALNNYGVYLETSGLKEMEMITNIVCDVYDSRWQENCGLRSLYAPYGVLLQNS